MLLYIYYWIKDDQTLTGMHYASPNPPLKYIGVKLIDKLTVITKHNKLEFGGFNWQE